MPNGQMEAIADSGHSGGIKADVRRRGRIPWITEAGIGSHHEKQESHFSRHRYRCRQEFVVPVASPQSKVRNHSGHRSIEIIGA